MAYQTYAVSSSDPELDSYLDALSPILHACVSQGASVNFLPPFSLQEAHSFWFSQKADIIAGKTILRVAVEDATKAVLGCVLLKLAQQPNQQHRADIGKMLVRPTARRRGIGLRLLHEAELQATRHGRWLLCLDTEVDNPAQQLYLKQYARIILGNKLRTEGFLRYRGYLQAGVIPQYALSNDGKQHKGAVFMYKLLDRAVGCGNTP